MDKCKIKRNRKDVQTKIYIPMLGIIVAEIFAIIFGGAVIIGIVTLSIIGIVYYVLLPITKRGIYLDNEGLTEVTKRGIYTIKWEKLRAFKHAINVNYHVLSLIEENKELHIPIEQYDSKRLVEELLQRVPAKVVDAESAKSLGRYYHLENREKYNIYN